MLGLIREALRKGYPRYEQPFGEPIRAHRVLAPLAVVALLLLFTAQLWTVAFMARHQIAAPCWLHLPIPVVADLTEDTGGPAQIGPSFLLVAIAAAQSGLLLLLYRSQVPFFRHLRIIISCACALAIGQGIFAPAMTSSDVYLYMTYAKLGFASYSRQPQLVSLKAFPIADSCERRILPSAYGPAFIAYAKALAAWPHSPSAQIILIRATNAAWFLAFLWALRCAGTPPTVVTLAALNPVLLFQFIANPHNDIIPSVLVVAAITLAEKSLLAGSIAVVAAALFKLPFALTGIMVFTQSSSVRKRCIAAGLTLTASLALSYLIGGQAYFEGLRYYNRLLAPTADPLQHFVYAVALCAIAVAVISQRFTSIATYAFPSLALQSLFPWYAIWSIPYALRERKHLALFFILMPIMALLMETGISKIAQEAAYAIVSVAIGISIARNLKKSQWRLHT